MGAYGGVGGGGDRPSGGTRDRDGLIEPTALSERGEDPQVVRKEQTLQLWKKYFITQMHMIVCLMRIYGMKELWVQDVVTLYQYKKT